MHVWSKNDARAKKQKRPAPPRCVRGNRFELRIPNFGKRFMSWGSVEDVREKVRRKVWRRLSILQEGHPKGEPTRLEPGIPYHIWRVSALLSCEVTRRRSDVATPFVFMCGTAFLPVEREAVA